MRWCVLLAVVFGASLNLRAAETTALEKSFQEQVKPFLKTYCERCHQAEKLTSGIRVDHLDASLDDRHLKLWSEIRNEISHEAMPPEGAKQPTKDERAKVVAWITQGLDVARARPTPKNGSIRRLTVAQYRHTLRELLLLDDDVTSILPPEAISRDGFVNNQATLQLSPLLLEGYLDVADKALSRSLVDPRSKPTIQHFRVDLGAGINPKPFPESLILGADSLLLKNADFMVTEPALEKPFVFEPFKMRTKYRFIEGYAGNATVRGWREYDSLYHSVFACVRGSHGYPKGQAYSTVPQGLLLRPAIPSSELFGEESTYGPKANFKIALRELPDGGRFRVTVTAAAYDDGLLLDAGTTAQNPEGANALVARDPSNGPTINVPQAGLYQVDIHMADQATVKPDASRLDKELIGAWALNGTTTSTPERKELAGRLLGQTAFVKSPFGQAVSFDGKGDSVVIPRHETLNVKEGDFTIAAWIHPRSLRQAGIVSLGKYSWNQGWYLDMPNNQGVLRIETAGPDNQSNGTVSSPANTLRANAWQHVAAVVRRGQQETHLYVNGYLVAKGKIGTANLDNPKVDLHIGRIQEAQQFHGEIANVHLYRRALDHAEVQALVEPGKAFAQKPRSKPPEATLTLGDRQFIGLLNQPAFLAVRLPAGPVKVQMGAGPWGSVVVTPLAASHPLAEQFTAFEKRPPLLGVHMGFRRDCGSTLSPVGEPQTVAGTTLKRYTFEGFIRNYPNPDVEKDNVNYLAGVREMGVRSEYTDGRDRPRLLIRSVEFEGPYYETWPPPSHRQMFVDFANKDDPRAYARHIIRTFATRAFRRPVTDQEEATFYGVYEKATKAGGSFHESIKDVLQVVLTSPQFLFLIENSRTPTAEQLDEYELASKLSYFLWNGPPDDALLRFAAQGALRKNLDKELTRLMNHQRSSLFVHEFASQWLAIDKFQVLEPDRRQFPKLTRDTRTSLQQEPIQFVQHLLRHNLSVKNLIASDFVLANEVTANYYGLPNVASGLRFEPVRHGRPELGGLLSQSAIMAGLSDGRESNPIKRGAWLARKLVAEPPDDPPPNVPALKEEKTNLSLRERLFQHRNQAGCAQCHSKIDPWGIPLEEFDAGGRFKTQKVDARSTLPDKTEVKNFADLQRYLVNDRLDQVAFSVLKHLAIYACGRHLTYNELDFLRREAVQLKATDYRLQDLIRWLVHSPIFLEK